MKDTQPEACRIRTPDQLRELVAQRPSGPCRCGLQRCGVWDSISDVDWPAAHMHCVADLRDPDIAEPSFEEYHPRGTRYSSADAPVALGYFPTNRCEVHRCTRCSRHWLRYTEFGGYYVDHRVRELLPDSIADLPAPA